MEKAILIDLELIIYDLEVYYKDNDFSPCITHVTPSCHGFTVRNSTTTKQPMLKLAKQCR